MSNAIQDAGDRAEKAHESYRGVGIALMVTVTGLSAGLFNYLETRQRALIAFSFVYPIVGALLQQSAHYAASFFLARMYFVHRIETYKNISDNLYTLSDALCLLTMLLFFGLSIWAGWDLGYRQMTAIGGVTGFLVVVIGLGIICKGLKKGRV